VSAPGQRTPCARALGPAVALWLPRAAPPACAPTALLLLAHAAGAAAAVAVLEGAARGEVCTLAVGDGAGGAGVATLSLWGWGAARAAAAAVLAGAGAPLPAPSGGSGGGGGGGGGGVCCGDVTYAGGRAALGAALWRGCAPAPAGGAGGAGGAAPAAASPTRKHPRAEGEGEGEDVGVGVGGGEGGGAPPSLPAHAAVVAWGGASASYPPRVDILLPRRAAGGVWRALVVGGSAHAVGAAELRALHALGGRPLFPYDAPDTEMGRTRRGWGARGTAAARPRARRCTRTSRAQRPPRSARSPRRPRLRLWRGARGAAAAALCHGPLRRRAAAGQRPGEAFSPLRGARGARVARPRARLRVRCFAGHRRRRPQRCCGGGRRPAA